MNSVRNLAYITRDRGYRFQDRDPILEFVTNDITDSGLSLSFISERSGVAVSTLRAWMNGRTRFPQNITVEARAKSSRLDSFPKSGKTKIVTISKLT